MSDKVTVKQTINKATSIVLTEEDFFSTEEREGVDRCIGVICSSVSYELFPNVHEDGGVGYQFLYEGDELKCYEHGLLIESVE